MHAVTIKHAKAHLNKLIEAASSGEQVILMRGSKHVAAIVPITEADLELAPRLTDAQAERFWRSLAQEREAGDVRNLSSMDEAVAHLKRSSKPRPRRAARR